MKTFRLMIAVSMLPSVAGASVIVSVSPFQGDNAPALQRVIDQAQASKADTVIYFSPGTYPLKSPLRIGPSYGRLTLLAKSMPVIITGMESLATSPMPESSIELLPSQAKRFVKAYKLPVSSVASFDADREKAPGAQSKGSASVAFEGATPLSTTTWPSDGFTSVTIRQPSKGPHLRAVLPLDAGLDAAIISREPALMIGGYFTYPWFFEQVGVDGVSEERRLVYSAPLISRYDEATVVRYRLTNVISKIATAGDMAFDPKDRVLLVWPKSDGNVTLATAPSLLKIDKADHVVIDGLAFRGAQEDAVDVSESSDIVISNAYLGNVGRNAVAVRDSSTVAIKSSVISSTGSTAVILAGGDVALLRPGNLVISDSIIQNFGQLVRTYNPAIELQGVGNSVVGCLISDGPHTAITFSGNEHRIIGNDISDVGKETGDAGAIYTGRDLTARGTRIMDNFFHDLHRQPGMPEYAAIYLDDYTSGDYVVNNAFVDVDLPVWINGGSNNTVNRNIFLRTMGTVDIRNRSAQFSDGAGLAARNSLAKITPAIMARYGESLNGPSTKDGVPRGNIISDNTHIDGPQNALSAAIASRSGATSNGVGYNADNVMPMKGRITQQDGNDVSVLKNSLNRHRLLTSLQYAKYIPAWVSH